jgi:hypothetical protein
MQDLMGFGAPGDKGVFQLPCSYLIFQFTFSGVTFCVALNGSNGKTVTDTIANSATVWQTSINACQVSGGKIFAKSGLYLIATKLLVTEPITIVGEGGEWENVARATVLQASAGITAIIEINISEGGLNSNKLTGGSYEDILLDGHAQATNDLLITDAIRISFKGITCINATTWGMVDLFNHTHEFDHCRFSYNGANNTTSPPTSGGARLGTVAGNGVNAATFTACSLEANVGCGLYLAVGTGIQLFGGVIESTYSFGLFSYFINNLLVMGTFFENNMTSAGSNYANMIYSGFIITFINPIFSENNIANSCLATSNATNVVIINPYLNFPAKGINARATTGTSYIGDLALLRTPLAVVGGNMNGIDTSATTHGFATTTPAIPASTAYAQNTNVYPVSVIFLTTGTCTHVLLKDIAGTVLDITTAVTIGMTFMLQPGGSIGITYAVAPTWKRLRQNMS